MFVYAFNKKIPVVVEGKGSLPLVIVGPASLFKKPGMLPERWREIFTLYFVDIFSDVGIENDYSHWHLTTFAKEFDKVLLGLRLDKVVLFAHSSLGIMAIEYAAAYPDKVLMSVLVAAMPIWGQYKQDMSHLYFIGNADQARKSDFQSDQKALESKINSLQGTEKFVQSYQSRRTYFFKEYKKERDLWRGITFDMPLIEKYFSLISQYDIRERTHFKQNGARLPSKTFLALGLWDYSAPFYTWTDDLREATKALYYYIFESDHYPMVDCAKKLTQELEAFIEREEVSIRAKL